MSCWGPRANISNLPQGTSSKIRFWFQKDHACLLANSEHAFKLYFFFFPWLHPLKALELAVCERGPFPPASEGHTKEGQPFYLARLTCDNGGEPNAEPPQCAAQEACIPTQAPVPLQTHSCGRKCACCLLNLHASVFARTHFNPIETCGFKYSPIGPAMLQRSQMQRWVYEETGLHIKALVFGESRSQKF